MNKKSIVVSYISRYPSLTHDPVKLARLILAENDDYSLKELIKEIKDTLPELLDEEEGSGYKKLIISKKTIRTKVDNEFDGNASAAARAMGVPERSMRRWYHDPKSKEGDDIKRFVITYGQNNTPVHLGFHNALQHYLKKNNAELIVYQGKYRNPTSIIEASKSSGEEVWDAKIRPYLLNTERKLNDRISIFPANTNPTATRPLSGFDVSTEDRSGIFPHPKYQFKTIPTPSKSLPKILSTTGAITIPNYSESKAGAKSKIHHIIGAVIVEIVDDKKFHIRQISADEDGSFYDIVGGECRKYSVDGVSKPTNIETLVLGDLHHPFIDKKAYSASTSQMEKLKPNNVFLHDVLDCWSVNHHSRKDRFLNTAKQTHGVMNIEHEVNGAVGLINDISSLGKHNVYVVSSNHDDALDRWLNDENADNLGVNAAYWHYLSWKKHLSATPALTGFKFVDAFQFSAQEKLAQLNPNTKNVKFLPRDVPFMIKGVDFSCHGDQGASGSRGSALGFSKIGVKTVIAHSHSPQVVEGCFQVGVNSLIPLGYAKGASGWLHTNCIQYPNGKRTLINMIDGEYYL